MKKTKKKTKKATLPPDGRNDGGPAARRYPSIARFLGHFDRRDLVASRATQRPGGFDSQQTAEATIELGQLEPRSGSPCDHDEIHVVAQLLATRSKPLSDASFEAIPANRVTDFTARGDSQPAAARIL